MAITADEFVMDYEPSLTAIVKSFKYGFDDVRSMLESGPNVRNTKDFEDAQDRMYELTMSCDEEEAIGWMKHWSLYAIAYGIETKDLNWKSRFLAANDILCRLVGKYNGRIERGA